MNCRNACFRLGTIVLFMGCTTIAAWTAGQATGSTASTAARVPASEPPAALVSRPAGAVSVLDFDGDGKTDYGVVRTVNGNYSWYLQRSTLGFLGVNWGNFNLDDQLVPADYDGDGKWDIAVWRSGTPAYFYILRSSTNSLQSVQFGTDGDDPRATQDFDGDGKADPTVTRAQGATLHWYILRSQLGFIGIDFGNGITDVNTRGDYDGDGKADIAVYRTTGGTPANTFFVLRSSNGAVQAQNWGIFSSDYLQPGDYDGDGKTDYAVCRVSGPEAGNWYWLKSSTGTFSQVHFGQSGDQPAVGDYDGDGKADQAVWRPGSPATFYVNRSTLGFTAFSFGQTNDIVLSFALQAR